MFTLKNNNKSVLNLGKLRKFLNETCRSLPNDTPVMISIEGFSYPCVEVLADEESVELYSV